MVSLMLLTTTISCSVKKRDRKIISKAQLQKQMSMLTGGTDFIGFNQLDMVVEAVFEDLALKHQMVRDIETHSKPDTIFATNTSSLPIHQIASAAQRPEQVVGLHYFSPVEKMPLVEIIPHQGTELGGATSQQTIETAITLAKKTGENADCCCRYSRVLCKSNSCPLYERGGALVTRRRAD